MHDNEVPGHHLEGLGKIDFRTDDGLIGCRWGALDIRNGVKTDHCVKQGPTPLLRL